MFNALQSRGWMGPALLEYPKDWNYVGEAWSFSRANWTLNLYFVADYGAGFHGSDSFESITGRLIGDSGEYDLWLHRTRGAKLESLAPPESGKAPAGTSERLPRLVSFIAQL